MFVQFISDCQEMFGCIVSEMLLDIWFWQPPDITSSVDLHFVCFVCIDGTNATFSSASIWF